MSTIITAITLIGGIVALLAAVFSNMYTHSNHRLGKATPSEVRQSQRSLATTVATVVVAVAGMALVMWFSSDFFSSNSLAGQSEEATTTPATSEPAQAEE